MLFSAFVAICVASGAFALPAGFNGLNVKIAGPTTSVNSINDLKFTATVTNTGAEDVKVLKFATVLDDLPTRSFEVTKNGEAVAFRGVKLSVSLNDLDDTSFVVIPAGKSVTVSHNVAALFDFATAGTGTYSFEPITSFKVIGATERVASAENFLKVQPAANKVEVKVTGDIARRSIAVNKRAVDICTTASKKSFIDARRVYVYYSEAKTLASGGVSYISSRGASDSLYKAYYGATATSRVSSILSAVANENSSSRTLSCVDSLGACSGGVIAYTATATTNIYFCSIFFNEVATSSLCSGTTVASRNVRGGTTLHELTHAVGGTRDVTYGCAADQALSDANSLANADNYNCFTTQVYQNTRC